ncbi:hypothetical protein WNY37_06825 [Henriciella sp. AS95]|uniref:hypothetical protein n=1 Tax=Henriciella sp. AS95 TaxID=3135782 RepID=UPI003177DB46
MSTLSKSIIRVALAGGIAAMSMFTANAQPKDMRFKVTEIMDPTGFEKPIVAATSVIPADWTTEGGIVWQMGMDCNKGFRTDWTATSADGEAMIRMLPQTSWRFNNQGMPVGQGCIPAAINSADEYVQGFIGQLDSPQIVSVERDPATSEALAKPPFTYEMQGDPYSKNWWDAASVTFDYKRDGKDYTAAMIVFSTHSYMLSGHSFGFGQPLEAGYGAAVVQILIAAPKDQIEDYVPAFMLFLKNYRSNPEWDRRIQAYLEASRPKNTPRQPSASSVVSNTYDEISDITFNGWKKRNEITSSSPRETSEWIRGVETYNANTPSGQIELPQGYDRAFEMNDGSFVVTNDAFFETLDGRELSVTQ